MDISDEILEAVADVNCLEETLRRVAPESKSKFLEYIKMNRPDIDLELYKRFQQVKLKKLDEWNDYLNSEIEAVFMPS